MAEIQNSSSSSEIHINNNNLDSNNTKIQSLFVKQSFLGNLLGQTQSIESYLTSPIFIGLAIFIFFIIIWRVKSKKSVQKNRIALIGERFSGKTQLFISLNHGKRYQTVPSIINNHSQFKLKSKKYDLCDYCGDHVSKDDIFQNIEQFHTIIHVVDGSDLSKLVQVAQFLYQVLINKSYQKYPANYILYFNKNDLNNYQGNARLQKKIEDEIQHLKSARKNQGIQKQNEQDYLKLSKGRFQLKKSQIKIVSGNAIDNIKDLELILDNL